VGIVGAAVALAGHAGADAIDDGWPYGTGPGMDQPGFYDVLSWTNGGRDQFGPISNTHGDYTVYHSPGGADWYTAHINNFVIPSFYSNEHTEVLSLLDDSAGYPSVGTVLDTTEMFSFATPVFGTFELFTNTVINDPELGYATQFSFLIPSISNTFLITEDGMKDVVSFGNSFTLFEIPFTADSGAGDASDAGDSFALLLAALDGST
jgi:hypothetical protein